MAVTLPFPTLTGTIVSTQLDSNFSTLANRFGNIVNADISSSAAIDIDKLSAQYERLIVTLKVVTAIDSAAATSVNGYNDASLSAVTTGIRLDYCPIPGDSSDANWSIYDVSWICTDTGDGATTVSVQWGYFDAVGAWQNSATVVSAITLANASVANDANDAHHVNSSATALDFNHGTGGNTPRSLALVLGTVGTGTLSAEGSFLAVSILLRRKIQAS